MNKRRWRPPTDLELEILWRKGDPNFIGPVEPPMIRWVREQGMKKPGLEMRNDEAGP